ncbi:MAG: hypothetical protein KJ630_19115 [Proteobacteria bacterium]|nr:hypothetical protein [Pseudomonadota bacterium]
MATWPATLPQVPLVNGYSEKPANNSIRSKMDVGPAKSRRRISAGVREHKASYLLTSAQLTTFETFYETTLLSGSEKFTWIHPRTKVSGEWRIKALPEWSPLGNGWYGLTLELELLP